MCMYMCIMQVRAECISTASEYKDRSKRRQWLMHIANVINFELWQSTGTYPSLSMRLYGL